ncbi:putative secretory lipase [Sarocladium strictum]
MFMLPIAVLGLSSLALAQRRLTPQTNTFNSDYELPDNIATLAGFDDDDVNNINIAVRFEQTNWATGSVLSDPFYTDLPSNAKTAPAGTLLKLEEVTEVGNYTIAPSLSLSRFVYQSKSFKGKLVPVSGYILWPYQPRNGEKKVPLVAWGHGFSGINPECAPSHVRNLWYQFSGPYELALSGYAVVATDYAGLGVPKDANGKTIYHEVSSGPAAGRDLLYAAQAARSAFSDKLTKDFVVMGHSQGGGGAWAAAQEQVKLKVPGYKGAIAISPVTRPVDQLQGLTYTNPLFADALLDQYPDLDREDVLTALGEKVLKVIRETQGCQSTVAEIVQAFAKQDPTLPWGNPNLEANPILLEWAKAANNGGKDFKGPLLVIQGDSDIFTPEPLTTKAVQETCKKYPKKKLEYVKAQSVSHIPAMYASRQIWLEWLDNCFYGNGCKSDKGKCTTSTIGDKAPRPLNSYTGDLNYFLSPALEGYQVA